MLKNWHQFLFILIKILVLMIFLDRDYYCKKYTNVESINKRIFPTKISNKNSNLAQYSQCMTKWCLNFNVYLIDHFLKISISARERKISLDLYYFHFISLPVGKYWRRIVSVYTIT